MFSEGYHAGVEVRVLRGDGTAFPEHKIVHLPSTPDQPATTICWLEIKQDVTFSIDVKLHSPILNSYHAGDYIYQSRIDGVIVDRIVDRTTDPSQRGHRFSSLLARGPSGYVRGQAKFTKLVTVDDINQDARLLNDESSSIQIDIEAGTAGAILDAPQELYYLNGCEPAIAKEKEAKRMDSAVRIVGAAPAEPRSTALWYPVDQQGPFHRFTFKYRTRLILGLLDVIRIPQPMIQEPISQVKSQKKQKGLAGGPKPTEDGVQKELYQVMLNMRREIDEIQNDRRDVQRDQAGAEPEVIDLTEDDSDYDSDIVEVS